MPDQTKRPSVVSPSERGRRGYDVMVSRTTVTQRRAWARRGGRKPNPTWDEIQAGIQPERRKRVTTVPARTDAINSKGEPIESYRFA